MFLRVVITWAAQAWLVHEEAGRERALNSGRKWYGTGGQLWHLRPQSRTCTDGEPHVAILWCEQSLPFHQGSTR